MAMEDSEMPAPLGWPVMRSTLSRQVEDGSAAWNGRGCATERKGDLLVSADWFARARGRLYSPGPVT